MGLLIPKQENYGKQSIVYQIVCRQGSDRQLSGNTSNQRQSIQSTEWTISIGRKRSKVENLISFRRRKRTLPLRPFRHSRNEYPCRFSTSQKIKRQKRY